MATALKWNFSSSRRATSLYDAAETSVKPRASALLAALLSRAVFEQPSERVLGQPGNPRALEPQAGHTDGNVQLTAAHLDVEGGGLLEALKIGRRQPNHGLAKSHHIEHSMPPSSSA